MSCCSQFANKYSKVSRSATPSEETCRQDKSKAEASFLVPLPPPYSTFEMSNIVLCFTIS